MSEWLRQSEAAEYLEINPNDLLRLRESGKGPVFYRKGVLLRYTQQDLDDWVELEFSSRGAPDESWDRVEPAAAEPAPDGDIFGPKQGTTSGERAVAEAPLVHGLPSSGPRTILGAHGQLIEAPDNTAGLPESMLAGVDLVPQRIMDNAQPRQGKSPIGVAAEKSHERTE